MKKRHKLGRRHSRKLFTKTAKRVHGRNVFHNPMRGGIRL
jgi:hypothetical protein